MAAIPHPLWLPQRYPNLSSRSNGADKVSAWMEATQIAGFFRTEASKLFWPAKPEVNGGLSSCSPPGRDAQWISPRATWIYRRAVMVKVRPLRAGCVQHGQLVKRDYHHWRQPPR